MTRYGRSDLNNMAHHYVRKLGRMITWEIILDGRLATLQVHYHPKGTDRVEIYNIAL